MARTIEERKNRADLIEVF